MEQEVLTRNNPEIGYIKLYKESRRVNWEIKMYLGTTKEQMLKLLDDIKEIHEKTKEAYGDELILSK